MKSLQQNDQFFVVNPIDSLQTIPQLSVWQQNYEQGSPIKVIPRPMNEKNTAIVLASLLSKMVQIKRTITLIYIVDSKERQSFLIKYTTVIIEKFFNHIPAAHLPLLTNSHLGGYANESKIVFCTCKAFIQDDLFYDHVYHGMVIETSNFVRAVRDGFGDYITDTYLRRAYIQALRLQECYRQGQKSQIRVNPTFALGHKKSEELQVIKLYSQSSQLEKKEVKLEVQSIDPSKKISTTFYNKRDNLLVKRKQKQQNVQFFQQNELVLISGLIYIIGFLYNQLQIKKSRNFSQFIEDFQNKTSLNKSFLENILRYFMRIYMNCPNKPYEQMEDMYLYSLCSFIYKVIKYSQMFPDDYQELFEIVKPDKLAIDRRESMIEESTSCLVINCKQNNKICAKVIKKKTLRCWIIQSVPCPEQYWHYIFKRNNILLNPQTKDYSNLYGLHISKTPSNEDINFAEKLSEGIETIKLKACGVLLHDLSKFIPDGIVVYFHSLEGLEGFMREMEVDQEAIIKKIDHHKKIFYQSAFQEQNRVNFLKFKKCCYIGRGAIFFMVANGKAAQYLKFYKHLSRCIVFFGLPRRQNQYRKELQLPENQPPQQKHLIQLHQTNMQKISIINECINNCINDPSDYKSIIFVGGQITSDLETWYKSFIRSWDETTRESLTKLRSFYQKMGKAGIFW